ncbi:MAG: imidazoleglycerol-phosphate dehydratase [Fervidicoccaceae archaeon]
MRRARLGRTTREVSVEVSVSLEGSGIAEVKTGIPMLDHLLETLAFYARFDLSVVASELKLVDDHHVVEEVALAIGRALDEALSDRRGVRRFGSAVVPMDDALALAAVDLGGRPFARVETRLTRESIGGLSAESASHFVRSLASSSRSTIHALVLYGENDHHKIEALFKALGLALGEACRIEGSVVPSLKGAI